MTKQSKSYNLAKLHELVNGDTGFMKEVISIFLKNIPENSKALLQAYSAKQSENIYFIAHKMKASIDLLGIEKIMEDIRTIELTAKSKSDLDQLENNINSVNNTIQCVTKEMKEDFNL